jgi:hypothetical protein
MYNREILESLIEEYGADKAATFCEMAAMMYDLKYKACKKLEPLTEFDFERVWWIEASLALHEQPIIKQ